MKTSLKDLFDVLNAGEFKIVAPVSRDNKLFFREVTSPDQISQEYLNTNTSVKEWFFPRTESVMKFTDHHYKEVTVEPVQKPDQKIAVVGVRPCDVKSLVILDKVFSWDYKDQFYLGRRENNLLITLACNEMQNGCYCDMLGNNYDSSEGADAVLKSSQKDDFDLKIASDKGKKLFPKAEPTDIKSEKKGPGRILDLKKIKSWLDNNFESEKWLEITSKCLGCGACAYVCPTCHCFDITDEANLKQGERRKNWDSCGFGGFTLHTSGHNPRPAQRDRIRNRIMHKFKYYPDKFDMTACVGCGRCQRVCPVNMHLKNILEEIENYE